MGKDRIALALFVFSFAAAVFGWGMAAGKYRVFPYAMFATAYKGLHELRTQMIGFGAVSESEAEKLPWYYRHPRESYPLFMGNGEAYPGPTLVTGVGEDLNLFARIVGLNGETLHQWDIDWFRVWPDATHLSADMMPRSKPGTVIHGSVVLDNGDLVFNYEHLGMVRLGREGEVVWRLPYRTHHSLELDDVGNLWACGQRRRMEKSPDYPYRNPPFDEYTVVCVSQDGEILEEWSIPQILLDNGRAGLLDMRFSRKNNRRMILDDRLHMNDVEPFPDHLDAGIFGPGDLLISMRDINTVLAFNRSSGKIKYIDIGALIHQHDVDFIDGNTYSAFDNRREHNGTRIAIVNAVTGRTETSFAGSEGRPFYTPNFGNHQWLPNGSLLLAESKNGRVFEVNQSGEIVWQYVNYVDEGIVGLVSEAARLPEEYADLFAGER